MTFENHKKACLAKTDKSKKGVIDEPAIALIDTINSKEDYYTTSSCSGRIYFWRGSGKKNETEWLKMSHELIDKNFLTFEDQGLVWLRMEGMVIHIACRDIEAARKLLVQARTIYKKSCLLSLPKFIVEIRGPEVVELPWNKDGEMLFAGDKEWLRVLFNQKLEKVWADMERLQQKIESLVP